MGMGFDRTVMKWGLIASPILLAVFLWALHTNPAVADGRINFVIHPDMSLEYTIGWDYPTTVNVNGDPKNITVIVNGTPVVTPVASSSKERLWGSCNGRNAVPKDDKTIVLSPSDAAALEHESEWVTCDLQPSSRGATVKLDGESYDVAPGKEFILSVPTSVLAPLSFEATMK